VGNPPEVTSDENSYAEIDNSRTIPDVPINKGYLTKITVERARRGRPDFISLYLAGREWSGTVITNLGAESHPLHIRVRV